MATIENEGAAAPACRRSARRSMRRVLGMVAAAGVCLTAAPRSAHAVGSDNFEFHWYSRLGMAWSLYGQDVQGQPMNLMKWGIGGRYEEGDYSEPTFVAHVVKREKPDDFYVDSALTFAMFPLNGSFIQSAANNNLTLGFEINQAYIEAGNWLIPGTKVWGGARFYRDAYAPIGDYFYFDDLTGQGGGFGYKGFDVAVLGQTGPIALYTHNELQDTDNDPATPPVLVDTVRRNRTIFVSNYKFEFGEPKHYLKLRGEFHVVPPSKKGPKQPKYEPADVGGVLGAKLHLALGDSTFNDTSVRWGTGIANAAAQGRKSFELYGPPGDDGTYAGSYGLEVVDHFGVKVANIVQFEGLATFHYQKAAAETANEDGLFTPTGPGKEAEKSIDFALGLNTTIFAHNMFHLVTDLSFQGRKDGDAGMGTAFKASLVPTFVPTGERSSGARPHYKIIYTAGFYNRAAVDQVMSPYLATTGAGSRVAHYIGARTDWYF